MKTKTFEVVAKLALILCLLIPCTADATGYTLTVSAQGSGTVTKNPTNAIYPPGVVVTITAAANPGWYFANWSGDAAGVVNPLNVTMHSDQVVTGNFLAYPTYTLSLATNGQGTITLSPPGGSYLSNTVVTATATPPTGWVFAGWSGGTNTSVNPVALTMNGNSSLTGTFAQLPTFDVQPVSVTNITGSTVIFYAHAVGDMPLVYHWFFSGGTLSGVTTSTILPLTNVSSGQAGNYWLVATNSYGSATSQIASLTVTTTSGPTNLVNSPDEASLRAAIAIGGWVGLGFNGTITITNTINITSDVILDAKNVTATISGGNAVRLFYVAPGVSFSATNLTFANGSCFVTSGTPGTPADAGAIYNNGGTVTLVACTLTNNSAQSLVFGGLARGGAIFNNSGTVTLNQSVLTNNLALGGGPNNPTASATTGIGLGGAVYNTNGTITITDCNVNGNLCQGVCEVYGSSTSATGLTMGGAAFQTSGSMTIANSSFAGNQAVGLSAASFLLNSYASPAYGGAVAVTGGNLSIDHSLFWTNQAVGASPFYRSQPGSAYGGAVYCTSEWTAADTAFFENQAIAGSSTYNLKGMPGSGGAIYNAGTLKLDRCSVYSNSALGGGGGASSSSEDGGDGLGGGIFNSAQLAMTNSTIALNSAAGGAGFRPFSFAPMSSGGAGLGGGVFNNSGATIIAMDLSIASNSCSSPAGNGFTNGLAAGFQIANTNGTLRLHNSLVAYSGTNSNAYGPITDDGFNICSDGSANFASGSSYNFTDPQLAPLGDYGGPTWCMALLPTSPAIDFGDSAGIPNTDQRGFVRPFGSGPDIGAFEYGSYFAGVLQLNITATKTNMLLAFAATPPNVYRLQASTNLVQWTDLNTNGPFASATNISQMISQQGFDRRYFRLLVQ